MGWASGPSLAAALWDEVREYIPDVYRRRVAKAFIREFEMHDCDTLDEAERLMADAEPPKRRKPQ